MLLPTVKVLGGQFESGFFLKLLETDYILLVAITRMISNDSLSEDR